MWLGYSSLRKEFKTVTELEREDEEAQAAVRIFQHRIHWLFLTILKKLQELLRRNTPAALSEANALMKVMTGYNQEDRPDYHGIFERECNAASRKAESLVEAISKGEIRKKIEVFIASTYIRFNSWC
jgi:hypothetical protein